MFDNVNIPTTLCPSCGEEVDDQWEHISDMQKWLFWCEPAPLSAEQIAKLEYVVASSETYGVTATGDRGAETEWLSEPRLILMLQRQLAQLETAKTALRFYADPANYTSADGGDWYVSGILEEQEPGQQARDALASIESE